MIFNFMYILLFLFHWTRGHPPPWMLRSLPPWRTSQGQLQSTTLTQSEAVPKEPNPKFCFRTNGQTFAIVESLSRLKIFMNMYPGGQRLQVRNSIIIIN